MKKILLAVGAVLLLAAACNKTGSTKDSPAIVACTPATGESAFNGKVAYIEQYKQYTLQSADGKTYYLRTTSDQASSLQGKMGKNAQANGTLVTPESSDVNVATVCP